MEMSLKNSSRKYISVPASNMQMLSDATSVSQFPHFCDFTVRSYFDERHDMDGFLDYLGLYRSDVAKDSTCLYRAVSEQLFNTQIYHEYLKEKCIEYMSRHCDVFEPLVPKLDSHLEGLKSQNVWAGPAEMHALSLKYKVNFAVYVDIGKPPVEVTQSHPKTIVLAGFGGHRYDCVYSKAYLSASAVCQSITYEILYKRVFNLGDDVNIAVEKMLHDKTYSKQRKSLNQSKQGHGESSGTDAQPKDVEFKSNCFPQFPEHQEIKKALEQGIPPFPYKVAKALDPNIYRNVEFDIWNEQKKETLKSEQYITPALGPGVKCKVHFLHDEVSAIYIGHIQEVEKKVVTVYIEELCRKCTVSEEEIEVIPIPQYKALTWQGGKTYRIYGDLHKADADKRSKRKSKRVPEIAYGEILLMENPQDCGKILHDIPRISSNEKNLNRRNSSSCSRKTNRKAANIHRSPFKVISAPRPERCSPPAIPPPVPAIEECDSGYMSTQNAMDLSSDVSTVPGYSSPEAYTFVGCPETAQLVTSTTDVINFEFRAQTMTTSTPLQIPRSGAGRQAEEYGTSPVQLTPGTPTMTYVPYPAAYFMYPDAQHIPIVCCPANDISSGMSSMYINTPPATGVTPPAPVAAWYNNGMPTHYTLPQGMQPGFFACSPPALGGQWASPVNYIFSAGPVPIPYNVLAEPQI